MLLQSINDFFHLLAAAVWVGGMIYAKFVLTPSLKVIDPPQQGKLFGAASKRFSFFAWASIVVLLITGLLEPQFGSFFDFSTSGLAMTIKYLMFFVVVVVGLIITIAVAPKMEKLAPKPGERPSPAFVQKQKQLALLALINLILGILILFAVSLSKYM